MCCEIYAVGTCGLCLQDRQVSGQSHGVKNAVWMTRCVDDPPDLHFGFLHLSRAVPLAGHLPTQLLGFWKKPGCKMVHDIRV